MKNVKATLFLLVLLQLACSQTANASMTHDVGQETPETGRMVVCRSYGLNVRAGAGVENPLATLEPLGDGTVVTLTGERETPVIIEWVEISDPVQGWVSTKYLCEE